MNAESNSRMMKTLPREKAFYFFTSIGNYIGVSASSLKEFLEKIGEVNVKSLEFHLYRGDFEKWINEVLQDKELATQIGKLQGFGLTGDALRVRLSVAVSNRLKQASNQQTPMYA